MFPTVTYSMMGVGSVAKSSSTTSDLVDTDGKEKRLMRRSEVEGEGEGQGEGWGVVSVLPRSRLWR